MKNRENKSESSVTRGSGNVFADLKSPSPGEALVKAHIAHAICELIRGEGLNQAAAAARLGVDQPKVSSLMHGKLRGFSIDRLLRFLNALGQDVDIVIHPAKSKRRGARGRIAVAA
ncbi:MAG: helix-turn-helix transcriptional regulator [Planctomycetota bacterium]|nr:helix-turn-helix transcriptional regulator [Planctomycetota bacterium]